MGCALSSTGRVAFEGARVVHINGYVEEFVDSVSVGDVTGGSQKAMLCTSGQLCPRGFRPLRVGDRLEPGRLYFLLPISVLVSDATPMDHAILSARLAAVGFDASTPVDVKKGGSVLGGRQKRAVRPWKPALDSILEREIAPSELVDEQNSPQ